EDAADHGGDPDHVGCREALDLPGDGDGVLVPGQDVLSGKVAVVVGLVDVGVDHFQVGVDVLQGLCSAFPFGRDPVELCPFVSHGVGGRAPQILFHAAQALGRCGTGRRHSSTDPAQDVHEDQAVFRWCVSGTDHRAVCGGGVNVGDGVAGVPGDG